MYKKSINILLIVVMMGIGSISDLRVASAEDTTLINSDIVGTAFDNKSHALLESLTYYTYLVDGDGDLWRWGAGLYKPYNTNIHDVVDFATSVNVWSNSFSDADGHSLILKKDGTVWGWGDNRYGELGIEVTNSTKYFSTPQKIEIDNVIDVETGWAGYSFALKKDGTVWAWGQIPYRDGSGTIKTRYTHIPEQLNLQDIVKIYGRQSGRVFYATDIHGKTYAWGSDGGGSLGLGNVDVVVEPTLLDLPNIIDIAAGAYTTTIFLLEDGTVWQTGYFQDYGSWPTNYVRSNTPVQINIDNVVKIGSGNNHYFAIKSDGTLWGWGENDYGEVGIGNNTDRFVGMPNRGTTDVYPVQIAIDNVEMISGGDLYTVAIKKDGSVWSWGNNHNGVLGQELANKELLFTPGLIDLKAFELKAFDVKAFELKIPGSQHAVVVMNEDGSQAIADATVEIEGFTLGKGVTSREGYVLFPIWTNEERLYRITVSREGYGTLQTFGNVTKGKATYIFLQADKGKPYLSAVFKDQKLDLLSSDDSFVADRNQVANVETNSYKMKITVAAGNIEHGVRAYQLIQDSKVILQNDTGYFDIPVIFADESGQALKPPIITKFKSGKTIYARVIDKKGNHSGLTALGLKISEPKQYSGNVDDTLELGKNLVINVPDYVPFFSGDEIELGWEGLPIEFEIDPTPPYRKIKIAVNFKKFGCGHADTSSGIGTGLVCEGDDKERWDRYKEEYEKAVLGRSDAGKAFGGSPSGFHAGKVQVDATVAGYGEGYLDEFGNASVKLNLLLKVSAGGEYTYQFFAGPVPLFVSVGVKGELDGSILAENIIWGNGTFTYPRWSGQYNARITLNVDGGIGANRVLSVGASGRGTVSWLRNYEPADVYDRVSLTGSISLVAHAWLFKFEHKIAENTWTLYDSYEPAEGYSAPLGTSLRASMHDPSEYTMIPRSQGSVGRRMQVNGDHDSAELLDPMERVVRSPVFVDAQPRLVKVGMHDYMFWLEDDLSRSAENRTKLVYAVSEDGETWSEPVAVHDDGTADFNYDLAVDGSDIHVVWHNSKILFAEGVTIEQMAAAAEIAAARIDTAHNHAVTIRALTDDGMLDTSPKISVRDGQAIAAWIGNSANDLFGQSGISSIRYSLYDGGQWTEVHSLAEFESKPILSLDAGFMDGVHAIAYAVDEDDNYETIADQEIYLSLNGAEPAGITNNEVMDGSPMFAKFDDRSMLLWYSEGNYYYTDTAAATALPVYSEPAAHSSDRFNVIDGDGQLRIIWKTAKGTEEEYNETVYAARYDEGAWSQPYKLFESAADEISLPDGYMQGFNAVVAYTCESGETTSLCMRTAEPQAKIELREVSFDHLAVSPNELLELKLSVENLGQQSVNGFVVRVRDTMGTLIHEESVESEPLPVGQSGAYVTHGFVVPADLTGVQTYVVSIHDADDHAGASAPEAEAGLEIELGYTDLALSVDRFLAAGREYADVTIRNPSAIPSTAVLRTTKDARDGAKLHEEYTQILGQDESMSYLFNLSELAQEESANIFYWTVEAAAPELYVANNTDSLFVMLEDQAADDGWEKDGNLDIIDRTRSSVVLEWTPVVSEEPVAYRIWLNGEWIAEVDGGLSRHLITGLELHTPYEFMVDAIYSDDGSPLVGELTTQVVLTEDDPAGLEYNLRAHWLEGDAGKGLRAYIKQRHSIAAVENFYDGLNLRLGENGTDAGDGNSGGGPGGNADGDHGGSTDGSIGVTVIGGAVWQMEGADQTLRVLRLRGIPQAFNSAALSGPGIIGGWALLDSTTMDMALVAGDFDGNGVLDVNDYYDWLEAYRSARTTEFGPHHQMYDLTRDGILDNLDFSLWLQHMRNGGGQ